MKILAVMQIALLFASCSRAAVTEPASTARAEVETSSAPSQPEGVRGRTRSQVSREAKPRSAVKRNVTIADPRPAVAISTNPFIIRGTARTFENAVSLRVRDEKGKSLAAGFTTATGDLGTFNPWEISLMLTTHPGQKLTIEAFENSARDGTEESLVRVDVPYSVAKIRYTLFFHDSKRALNDCSKVFPFIHEMPVSKSALLLVVEALMRGPSPAAKRQGASSSFPEGSAVQSVTIRDGAAIVDFNEKLANVGGACRAQAIRASLDQTLTKLPGVKRVIVRSNGSESAALQP